MENINQKEYERSYNIRIAANHNPEMTDILIGNLFQLLGYRQKIAHDLLNHKKESEECDILYNQFDYINTQIKKLLGLQ